MNKNNVSLDIEITKVCTFYILKIGENSKNISSPIKKYKTLNNIHYEIKTIVYWIEILCKILHQIFVCISFEKIPFYLGLNISFIITNKTSK